MKLAWPHEFNVEGSECEVGFKGPGYEANAFIQRGTGAYRVSETRFGWVAVLNDLHKARDTGYQWGKAVDLSALLMILVSLTGLTLIV